MKISNIFLGICILFIISVFFISPRIIEINKSPLANYNDLPEDFILEGKIVKEPEIKSNKVSLVIKTEKGKALITTSSYPEWFYGDVVRANGKLKSPVVFESFNYKNYLAKDGIYSVVYWPELELIERNKGNPIFSAILKFKNNTIQKVEAVMPFPEVSILEGIVLGSRQIFSENLKNQLSVTGMSHIVAISGMNIVIISEIFMFVLIALGLWRKHAFYAVLVIIFLFVIMVGAPASAVRAAIMGAILLWAQKIGRLNNAARVMIFAAAIMLLLNPLLLRYDIGFQLSFLAVFGLIYLKPIFDNAWGKRLKKEYIGIILQTIDTTIAAQIAVLPILVYNFGNISFISPVANIFIVPAITFLTILAFVFIGSVLFLPFLAKILAWPVYIGFAYITKAVDLFSQVPFASKQIAGLHWIWPITYYVLLAGFLIFRNKKKLQKFKKINI